MPEPEHWRAKAPPDEAWKPPRGRAVHQARAEQDQAAGGRERRRIHVGDGRRGALASVELKRPPNSRRVYAYLRWAEKGRTINRYLGEVTANTRARALAQGWEHARNRGLAKTT